MVRITSAQMDALSGTDRFFVARQHKRLRDQFGDNPASSPEAIRGHLDEARGFSLDGERALAGYLDLKLFLGDEFPHGARFGWARRRLGDKAVPPVERIDWVQAGLMGLG